MKITRTDHGSEIKLVINSDAKELERLKKHVLGHFRGSVRIPGFREGAAPDSILEKHIDRQKLIDEVINHAVNEFYRKAVEVEKIRPVGEPKITIKKFVPYSELEIDIEVEAIGEIILPDYRKIKVSKKPVKVLAKDIDEVLQSLRQRLAERQLVERPARLGDEVLIDFDGFDAGGRAVAGASAKRNPVILGGGNFVPGFEEKLVGAGAGQELEFKIKFPGNYGVKELANQNVDFKVRVHSVNKIIEPKLDDVFAAKAGPFKTLAELKADIKKQLTAERESQAARELENEIVRKITEKTRLEVPNSLVDQELERLEAEEKRNIAFRGQTWQEHLDQERVTEEQHRERQRPLTEQRVRGGLVLSEIAEREKVQVTSEEADQRIELLKAQYSDEQMRAELDKPESRNQIISQMLTEKTVAKLVEYAR